MFSFRRWRAPVWSPLACVLLVAAGCGPSQKKLYDQFADACFTGEYAKARQLLERGADPNSLVPGESRGFTALAVSLPSEEMVDLLIRKGADVNRVDANGLVPAEYAASTSTVNVLRKLEAAGVNLSKPFPDGRTFLHVAVDSGKKPFLDFALSKGLDVNARDRHGFTALHALVTSPSLDGQDKVRAIKYLLAKGADLKVKDHKGLTACDWASKPFFLRRPSGVEIQSLVKPRN